MFVRFHVRRKYQSEKFTSVLKGLLEKTAYIPFSFILILNIHIKLNVLKRRKTAIKKNLL